MSSVEPPPDDRLLSDLLREVAPPSALEERLVGELERRGLLGGARPPRGVRAGIWRVAASALLAFALGLWLGPLGDGKAEEAAVENAGGRYLLLLYEPRPLDRAGVDLVAEYSAWAGELAQSGRLIAAEKLADGERRWGALPPPGEMRGEGRPARGEPTGFFLIRASGPEEAERIARDCPHLRHGGELSLRPVDPT